MAAISWKSGTSGNWNLGSDWSTGAVPGATDDAIVAVAGSYTVTLNDTRAAKSLTLNDATATVNDTGSLALTGALALDAGTFVLGNGGLLQGGTVSFAGGTLLAAGGTLSGSTVLGTLDLSPNNSTLSVTGNLTLAGTGGTGPGTVQITGSGNSQLDFAASSTLDNATVNMGNASNWTYLYLDQNAVTLTLGSKLNLQQTGTYAQFYAPNTGDTIINQGTINAGVSGGRFILSGGTFVNKGTVGVSNTDSMDATGAVFSNTGLVTVAGGTLVLSSWSNTGTIDLTAGVLNLGTTNSAAWTSVGTIKATGGTLNLGGTFTDAQFAGISAASTTADITGTLDNTGGTLTLSPTGTLGAIGLFGTIKNGVIVDATGGGLVAHSGTLSGVTYEGTLDLGPNNSTLSIAGSLTLLGATGTGPGTVKITGYNSQLDFAASATLDNATISMGNTSSDTYLFLDQNAVTLTLGPKLNIQQVSTYVEFYAPYSGGSIVNQGTIGAAFSGGQFYFSGGSFINQGSIGVANNDSLNATGVTFSNSGLVTVAGGTLTLGTWSNTGTIALTAGLLSLGYNGSGAWTGAGTVKATGGTLDLGGTLTSAQLSSISASNAAVNIIGTLDNTGGTLALGFGTALGNVDLSGTIKNGVIIDGKGGGLVANSGTLNGVTYDGTLDLSPSNSYLYLLGSVSLAGATGTGAGTIKLTGNNSYLYVTSSMTLDNATVKIGNASNYDYIYLNNNNVTLTLGPHLIVQQTGAEAQFYAPYSGDTIINEGSIAAGVNGGQFYFQYGTFINQGTISVSNSDSLYASNDTFTNSGLVTVAGGTLTLGTWANTGTISLSAGVLNLGTNGSAAWTSAGTIKATGGTLNLGGSFTNAQLSALTPTNTTVNILGTLTNSGTLAVGSGTALGTLTLAGNADVVGGVIVDAAGGGIGFSGSPYVQNAGPTLNGVSYHGTLSVLAANQTVFITNGLTLSGAGGTGPGAINLTGASDRLEFTNSTTFDNASVSFGSVNSQAWGDALDIYDGSNQALTLTLGAHLSVTDSLAGSNANFGNAFGAHNDVVANLGTIAATAAGAAIHFDSNNLSNAGLLEAINGGTIDLSANGGNIGQGASLLNLSGGTLTGGSYWVGAGSLLQLVNNSPTIGVDAASITLSGAGSVIESYSNATNSQISLDATLASIAAGGTLALLNGRNFTVVANSGSFSDSGLLALGGGTFTSTQLTLSGGTLSGGSIGNNGTLNGGVAITGSASVGAGALTLVGAVSGTGSLSVRAGAMLTLNAGGAINGAIADSGTIALTGGVLSATSLAIAAGGQLGGFGAFTGGIIDAGLIDASGGTLSVQGLTGISGGKWTGGGLEADAAAVLQLGNNANVQTDAGSITLSGLGSKIQWLNTTSNKLVALDSTLSSITAPGTLALLNGRSFNATANAGSFSVAGTLLLGGGTFNTTSLSLTSGALVNGSGTIGGTVSVTGAVRIGTPPAPGASPGLITLLGPLTGAGTLAVAAGTTLHPAAGGSFTGTLNDAGVVQLSGGTLNTGALNISAGGTVSGAGTIIGAITDLGLIDATGGTLSVAGLAGLTGGTLTDAIEADAASVLQLAPNVAITTVAGGITLSGLGSVIESLNTTTTKQVALDATLAAIAATGTLLIEASRPFTATANAGTFTDAGLLDVSNGSFTATRLNITATGTLLDAGGFVGAISNAGTVSIAGGDTLALNSGGALGGVFTGDGTLRLAGTTPFTVSPSSTLSGGLVQVAAGTTLGGNGTIAAPLDVQGTVVASGGTLTLDGALTDSGTLAIAAGAVLHLADGGTFLGTVTGAGSLVNDDAVLGPSFGASLSGTGVVSLTNHADGELSGGLTDGADLTGTTAVVVSNAGAIGGVRHGLWLTGAPGTVTNSGLISADIGAAILASGPGPVTINNTGVIADYEGVGVAALSLAGAQSATVTNAGTIIGGYYLSKNGVAIQFGTGNNRLVDLPGGVIIGTVRGSGGADTLELAAAPSAGTTGTLSGLGSQFLGFGQILEDANALWQLAGANTLAAGSTIDISAGATLTLAGTLVAVGGSAIGGPGAFSVGASGLLDATGGGTVALGAANLANLAGGTLTGGGFEVDAATTLQLANNAALATDDSALTLSGAGATVQWLTTATSKTTTLAQSLTTIGTAGTLSLVNGATFADTGTLADQGILSLSAASFTAASLTVAASGTAIGTGTIGGPVSDLGLVEASGGTLALTGAVTGAGTIGIDANSVLTASGTLGAANISFLDSGGGLVLAKPASVTGSIAGFATSDSIDLLGSVVTSESFVNDVLTLKGAGGTLAALHFTGDYSGYGFAFAADGHGGSNIFLI